MLWQPGIDKFCVLISGRNETGQMQFGREREPLIRWLCILMPRHSQNKEVSGWGRPGGAGWACSQSRENTRAGLGGRAEAGNLCSCRPRAPLKRQVPRPGLGAPWPDGCYGGDWVFLSPGLCSHFTGQGAGPTQDTCRFSLQVHTGLLKVLDKLRVHVFLFDREATITDSSDTLFGSNLLTEQMPSWAVFHIWGVHQSPVESRKKTWLPVSSGQGN